MEKAKYYTSLKEKRVQCVLCPHFCVIEENKYGNCKVRLNKDGKLYSIVYGKPCAVNIDPIEKKPQFHFLPGSFSYSIGTAGCNLHCKFCQNWDISQFKQEDIPFIELSPKKAVDEAIRYKCDSIAYTYNDPVVFYEYALDTAKIARKKGLKNIFVTNGYINPGPLREICKYIDGFHVDLKGFTEKTYQEICGGKLKPVLESLKTLKEEKKWFEIIHLTIPNVNDGQKEIKEMCEWIAKKLGKDTVIHFSKFFPCYKMSDYPPTPEKILLKAGKIAKSCGLNYVYIGNIHLGDWENTYCPKCKRLLIEREGFGVISNNLVKGKCSCGHKIAGFWG